MTNHDVRETKYQELVRKGEFREIKEITQQDLDVDQNKAWYIWSLINLKENNIIQTFFDLISDMKDNRWKSEMFNSIGIYYLKQGNLNTSIEYLNQCIYLSKIIDDLHPAAYGYNTLSVVYGLKSDLDKAIHYLEKCKFVRSQLDQFGSVSAIDINRAGLYHNKGETEEAIRILESLRLDPYFQNHLQLLDILFYLINMYISQNKVDQAKTIHKVMTETNPSIDSNRRKLLIKATEAMILASSSRIRDKIKAQNLFGTLINSHDFLLDICIYWYIIDILIEEYTLNQDSQIISELQQYLDDINDIAQTQDMKDLMIEYLLVKSKVKIIDRKFDQAYELIKSAEKLALDNDLEFELQKVTKHKKQLQENLEEMKKIISSDVYELINQTQIKNYIDDVKHRFRL